MADLTTVHAKLDRAERHARDLDGAIDDLLSEHRYVLSHGVETDGWYVFRWRTPTPEPDFSQLPLMFGDILTNLRATLDYLVWQLVLANGGQPTDRHNFPCVKDSTNWPSAAGDRLRFVDPVWVAEIRKLQPFNVRDRGELVERHLLAVLDRINNMNKHRTLPAVLTSVKTLPFELRFAPDHPEAQLIQHVASDFIKNDAPAFRLRFVPEIEFEVVVDADPSIRISFDDGLNRADGWFYTNRDLVDWVKAAVSVFEPAFNGVPHSKTDT